MKDKKQMQRGVRMKTFTERQAEAIYEYMSSRLAEGVYINPKDKKEMIKEIEFMMEGD